MENGSVCTGQEERPNNILAYLQSTRRMLETILRSIRPHVPAAVGKRTANAAAAEFSLQCSLVIVVQQIRTLGEHSGTEHIFQVTLSDNAVE